MFWTLRVRIVCNAKQALVQINHAVLSAWFGHRSIPVLGCARRLRARREGRVRRLDRAGGRAGAAAGSDQLFEIEIEIELDIVPPRDTWPAPSARGVPSDWESSPAIDPTPEQGYHRGMIHPSARHGAFLAGAIALGLTAGAPGCLFAPDACRDLLQCRDTGEGGGSTSGSESTSSGDSTSSGGPTVCASDADCHGGAKPTCVPSTLTCRDCSSEDCRAPLGSACLVNEACVSGLCAAGACAPCATDAECPSQLCAASACKARTGAPCGQNSDCVGGECRFGLCRANIGHACSVAEDCFNGVCTSGACAACFDDADCPGTACGTQEEIGRCLLPQGAGCWPDVEKLVSCFSGTCAGFPSTCQ